MRKKNGTNNCCTKGLWPVLLLTAMAVLAIGALMPGSAGANITINGSGTYAQIQDALFYAKNGDILEADLVGSPYEPAMIDKSVTLRAKAGLTAKPVIEGTLVGVNRVPGVCHILEIKADNVTVKGFTIRYSGTTAPSAGIFLDHVTKCTIENNYVQNNYDGILLQNSPWNTIRGNWFQNNDDDGIELQFSDNNTFENNTSTLNAWGGWSTSSLKAVFTGNHFTYNRESGLTLAYSSDGATVDWNDISNNYGLGVSLEDSKNTTMITRITNNTMASNSSNAVRLRRSQQIVLQGNAMTGGGIFIEGDPSQYWSGHTIDTSNTVNGYAVYYRDPSSCGTPIPPNAAGEVIIAGCNNQVVANQGNLDNTSVGVLVGFSDNVSIHHNDIKNGRYGIYLSNSRSATLANNAMTNTGIFVTGDNHAYWDTHTIAVANTVNGKPVFYLTNPGVVSGAGQVILAGISGPFVLSGQNLSQTTVGISVGFCQNITLTGNTVSQCHQHGIYVYQSKNVSVGQLSWPNTLRNNGSSGVCYDNASTVGTVEGNKFNGPDQWAGVWALNGSQLDEVASNTFVDNWVGIIASGNSIVTLHDNSVANTSKRGDGLFVTEGSKCYTTWGMGLWGDSVQGTATGLDCKAGASCYCSVRVQGLSSTEPTDCGISVQGAFADIYGLSVANSNYGICLGDAKNGTRFEEATISALDTGIYAERSDFEFELSDIQATNYGIRLFDSSDAVIHSNTIAGGYCGISMCSQRRECNEMVDFAASSPKIYYNKITAGTYGIEVGGGSPEITENMITAPEKLGPCYEVLYGNIITELLNAKVGTNHIDDRLDKAIQHIEKAGTQEWWVDDEHLDPKHGAKVFDEMGKAVVVLEGLVADKEVPDSVKDVCLDASGQVGQETQGLGATAVADAEQFKGTSPPVDHEIASAEKETEKGDAELAAGDVAKGIDHYQKAWKHAQKAIERAGG